MSVAVVGGKLVALGGGIGIFGVGGAAAITTPSLTNAVVGQTNTVSLSATGIVGTALWSTDSITPNEQLLTYTDASGNLQWDYPQTTDTITIVLRVTDSANSANTATKTLTWTATNSGSLAVVTSTTLAAINGALNTYKIIGKGGTAPYSVSGTPIYPSVTGGSVSSLTDSSQAFPANGMDGGFVFDNATNQQTNVTANTATALTVSPDFTTAPVAGDAYGVFPAQPWSVTVDGWFMGAPTSTGTYSPTLYLTDSAGTSVAFSPTITTVSGSSFAGIDPLSGKIFLPTARVGQKYQHAVFSYGGSGNITATGMPAWMSCSTAGVLTGTPTSCGTFAISLSQGALSATALIMVQTASTITRPAYNSSSSNGFFAGLDVSGVGRLYDPNGKEFVGVGLNRLHYDSPSWAFGTNGALTGINCARPWPGFDGGQTPAEVTAQLTSDYIDNDIFPIVTCAGIQVQFTGSISGTTLTVSAIAAIASGNCGVMCIGTALSGAASGGTVQSQLTGASGGTGTYRLDSSQSGSGAMTGNIGNVSGYTDLNCVVACTNHLVYNLANGMSAAQQSIGINIANEWGNAEGAVTYSQWQSVYTTAIAALRAAGFNGPCFVDLLSFGEDFECLSAGYAATMLAADPLHNVVFSCHLYGSMQAVVPISTISKATNAVVSLGAANKAHPLAPWFNGSNNSYAGLPDLLIEGVSGMTQANGEQPVEANVGGTPGAWTVSLTANSTGWGTYTGGGVIQDSRHYLTRAQALAGFKASGLTVFVGEFGPENLNATLCGITQFMSAMLAYGIGTCRWAYDDNNAAADQSHYIGWFGDTGPTGTVYTNGVYSLVPSQLTASGMTGVSNPRCGLQALAAPADFFL